MKNIGKTRVFTTSIISALLITALAAPYAWASAPDQIAGKDRFSTAIEISKTVYAPADGAVSNKRKTTVAYLSRGDDFIDALAASRLNDGPILFVAPGKEEAVKAELSRLNVNEVIALGGTAALPESLLLNVAGNKKTARIDGVDRYATAANIAKRVIANTKASTVLLARGDIYADALAAAMIPIDPTDPKPILLVAGDRVPEQTSAQIKTMAARNFIALGGPAALPDKILREAASIPTMPSGTLNVQEAQARFDEANIYLTGWILDTTTNANTKPYIAATDDADRALYRETPTENGVRLSTFAGWTYLEKIAKDALNKALKARELLAKTKIVFPARTLDKSAWDAYTAAGFTIISAPKELRAIGEKTGITKEIQANALVAADSIVKGLAEKHDRVNGSLLEASEKKNREEKTLNLAKQAETTATIMRLGGENRYATAVAISRYTTPGSSKSAAIYLARADGDNTSFADALAAGSLRHLNSGVSTLLLVPSTGDLPTQVREEIGRISTTSTKIVVLGGSSAIADSVLKALDVTNPS